MKVASFNFLKKNQLYFIWSAISSVMDIMTKWYKVLFVLCVSILISELCSAQSNSGKKEYVDLEVNPGGVLDEFPIAPPEVKGTSYIDEEWRYGKVVLKNGKVINNVWIRYDLQNDYMELNIQGQIRISNLNSFDRFEWHGFTQDRVQFINIDAFYPDSRENIEEGIFEILYQGTDVMLGKKTTIQVKDPDYVVALNMGNRNFKLIKQVDYFLVQDGQYSKINTSKKIIGHNFGDEADEIFEFVSASKLKPKKEAHLIRIVQKYQDLKEDVVD